MTVIARRVAAIPVRLASDTWPCVVDLVAPSNDDARAEMLRVTGISSSLITRQAMSDSPIVVAGDGPRIRVYCIHGEKAIEGETVNEAALPDSPAESGEWFMSLPCPADDLTWVQASLKHLSSRITARDMEEKSLPDTDEEPSGATATIDQESFLSK